MTACPTCRLDPPAQGRPVLCGSCDGHVRRDLARLPGLHEALAERLIVTGRGGPAVTGTRDVGINLNAAAVDARRDIRSRLASWARLVVEDRDVNPPAATLIGCAAFLLRHHDWLVAQMFADEYADEIAATARRSLSLVDALRPRQYGGSCDQVLDDADDCPGTVLVDPERRQARCTWCGTTTTSDEHWMRVFAEVADDWLATAAEASRLLAIRDGIELRADRVRQWASRGRVTPHGTRGRDPLYRLGDLLELLDDTAVSRGA